MYYFNKFFVTFKIRVWLTFNNSPKAKGTY